MAKALPITSAADVRDPYEWLGEVLRIRFAEVLSFREAALDENEIEGIHDMRVAIRRLRSLIRDLSEITDKFPLKSVRGDLKRLADALGSVRDADVAIESLEKLYNECRRENVAAGIDIMLTRLKCQRIDAFTSLLPVLSVEPMNAIENRFEEALAASLRKSGFQTHTLTEVIHSVISNRIRDFQKLADALYEPFRINRLHRLRIAGKHLRYAVELLGEDSDGGIGEFSTSIAEMQTHLGDVHDCDEWMVRLRFALAGSKTPASGSERSASIWLMSQFSRTRNKAYRSALELWGEWEDSRFLERLAAYSFENEVISNGSDSEQAT